VGFWRGRWFFLRNYAMGREGIVTASSAAQLEFFDDWQTAAAFAAHSGVGLTSARRSIAALLRIGALESSRRRSAAAEAMDRWASWNPYAGFFHTGTRDSWYDDSVAGSRALREKARSVPVPARVKRYRGARVRALPRVRVAGEFPGVLLDRRTWRQFSPRPLPLDALSTLLALTGGIHQWASVPGQPDLALKTSPSGGARHPIELYLWARRVEGIAPGLYHYRGDTHRLEVVRRRGGAGVQQYLPTQFWYEQAPAIVFFTAIYERYQWKYADARAYRATLIEAGHQCQTFCLTATWLGLAPFCSMALADSDIEADLRLDGISESVLYAAGVGIRPRGRTLRAMPRGFDEGRFRATNLVMVSR